MSLGGSTELTVPQGDGSGLNADQVDGNHASAFADAVHNHDTSLEDARKENNLLDGDVEFSSKVQIEYDTDKTDSPLHFQREATSLETALTILGTKVGIGGRTSPSSALDVRGDLNVSGTARVGGSELDEKILATGLMDF